MSHLEKLRADVQYWETADREARKTLSITERLLPDLRKRLAEAEDALVEAEEATGTEAEARATDRGDGSPIPAKAEAGAGEGEPRLTGECLEQVEQALKWKAPQSSHDLRDNLAKHGRAYGLGAIGYALRSLKDQGKVEDASKQGNMKFYRPKPPMVLASTVDFGDPE